MSGDSTMSKLHVRTLKDCLNINQNRKQQTSPEQVMRCLAGAGEAYQAVASANHAL